MVQTMMDSGRKVSTMGMVLGLMLMGQDIMVTGWMVNYMAVGELITKMVLGLVVCGRMINFLIINIVNESGKNFGAGCDWG